MQKEIDPVRSPLHTGSTFLFDFFNLSQGRVRQQLGRGNSRWGDPSESKTLIFLRGFRYPYNIIQIDWNSFCLKSTFQNWKEYSMFYFSYSMYRCFFQVLICCRDDVFPNSIFYVFGVRYIYMVL